MATKLYPYLNFAGNAEEALEFYRSVFGGEFKSVVRFKDMPMQGSDLSAEEADKIMHIALPIGDDLLMASDALESHGQHLTQGNNNYICVVPPSREEADRIFAALSLGADVEMPLSDQPWGDYFGSLKDKFGVMWMIDYGEPQDASQG